MSYQDVTDEMREDAYRVNHPECAVCRKEVCLAGVSCPSCKLDTPAGINMEPGLACPDYVCGTACRVAWTKGKELAADVLDSLFSGTGEKGRAA